MKYKSVLHFCLFPILFSANFAIVITKEPAKSSIVGVLYSSEFSGNLPEEILQPQFLPRIQRSYDFKPIIGLIIQPGARPSDYARLKKVAPSVTSAMRGRRNIVFHAAEAPEDMGDDYHVASVRPVYSKKPEQIVYETTKSVTKETDSAAGGTQQSKTVQAVLREKLQAKKVVIPKNYPVSSTAKPRTTRAPSTTTAAPGLSMTQMQETFQDINTNASLAYKLKQVAMAEFNNSVISPASANGVVIDGKRVNAMAQMLVVNENGVSCDNVCGLIEDQRVGYGTLGLCTPKFCQCDFTKPQYNPLNCPSETVFDPILLACNSPKNVVLCNDSPFEEEPVPTTQKPPKHLPQFPNSEQVKVHTTAVSYSAGNPKNFSQARPTPVTIYPKFAPPILNTLQQHPKLGPIKPTMVFAVRPSIMAPILPGVRPQFGQLFPRPGGLMIPAPGPPQAPLMIPSASLFIQPPTSPSETGNQNGFFVMPTMTTPPRMLLSMPMQQLVLPRLHPHLMPGQLQPQFLNPQHLKTLMTSIFQQATNHIDGPRPTVPNPQQGTALESPNQYLTRYSTLQGHLVPPAMDESQLPRLSTTTEPQPTTAETDKPPIYAYVNMQTYFVLPPNSTVSNRVHM